MLFYKNSVGFQGQVDGSSPLIILPPLIFIFLKVIDGVISALDNGNLW